MNSSIVVSLLVAIVLAGCADGSEEEGIPLEIPDLERLPESAIEELGEAETWEAMRFDGEDYIVARLWTDEELSAPFTREPCAYWWYEAAWDTPDVFYHITTQISKNTLFVENDGKLIEVGLAKRGMAPQFRETYKRGEEPDHLRIVNWDIYDYPEVTYEEWTLKQGGEYKIRVEVFGSAIEGEEEGEVIYETYYHYTFLELLD